MRLRSTRASAVAAPRRASPWAFYQDFTSGVLDPRIAFSRTTPAWFFNSGGVLVQAAANVPRFAFDPVSLQPQCLQFEAEARTNSITRSDPSTAIPGSPGTVPTGWGITLGASNGVTRSIAGVGSTAGIPWMDVSFVGTFAAAENVSVIPAPGLGAITASAGQVWSGSLWWAVQSGSLPGTGRLRIRFGNPAFVNSVDGGGASVGAPFSAATRDTVTGTAAAGVTVVGIDWLRRFAAGEAINCVVRFGPMQLELGSSVSSYIPTFGAAVTRAADVALLTGANFSSWYAGATECTLFSETLLPAAPGAPNFPKVIRLLSADFTSSISSQFTGASMVAMAEAATSGVNQGSVSVPCSPLVFNRTAFRAAPNNLRLSVNGSLSGIDSTATLAAMTRMDIGVTGFMGFIKAVGVARYGMSDAELQALTA